MLHMFKNYLGMYIGFISSIICLFTDERSFNVCMCTHFSYAHTINLGHDCD